mgnify:CR=1 FL=1
MIAVNLVWAAHPVWGKVLLGEVTPFQAAWLRYFVAWLTLLGLTMILRLSGWGRGFEFPRGRAAWIGIVGIGISSFFMSPLLQATGLLNSGAIENALIIAMEPLLIVFFAWLFLKEKMSRVLLMAFAMAIGGFVLLSSNGGGASHVGVASSWVGNLLMLTSLLGEAGYSIIGKKMMRLNLAPLDVYGGAIGVGVLAITLLLVCTDGFPRLGSLSVLAWIAIFWMGSFGTTLGYWYWMQLLMKGSVSGMALSLFIQPLAGAIGGAVFLGEQLTLFQGLGGGLILVSMGVQALSDRFGETK